MKQFLKGISVSVLVFGSVAALANDPHRGEKRGGLEYFDRHPPRSWTCRAEATDNSGLFFLGMGRTYGEAYARANETCNRARRICRIDCYQNN
jgi:hypothetical protein